ncbi:MAG TPA: glycosyltransferase family 2 protein [Thermoleophilaceae bacterium]|nr:glycosyltransferase family 2 protein [Thermoleophilaceae bacterium]
MPQIAPVHTTDPALDPSSRALLDLSLRHGLSDAALADTLGVAAADIEELRARALGQLARAYAEGDAFAPAPPRRPEAPRQSRDAADWVSRGSLRDEPRASRFDLLLRVLAAGYLAILLIAVVAFKAAFVEAITTDPLLTGYGLVVCAYIVSRFLLSMVYRGAPDRGLEPHVAIVMPALNEEEAIAASLRSLLASDYPEGKLEIVAVNDGSTDATLTEMRAVAAETGRVRVIDFPENRGKRAAMAAGIAATSAEIVAFVDSDSALERDALRRIVQGFADPKVGAVCGHAEVQNPRESWITRMQAVRYFVAFRVVKAAESVFGAVTCCSGCFSAYRRDAILPRLEWWANQSFLGVPSTFGDDRSLTNCVLRDWRVRYESRAVSHTIVPETFHKFMRQQLRWKRSWTRESLIVSAFMWRKNPFAALATYVGILLPLVAPAIAVRTVVWMPLVEHQGAPVVYMLGVYTMALAYGLYYAVRHTRSDTLWIFGVVFCFFYLVFLLWQTYWAMFTARTAEWGTRAATAGMGASP